MIPATPSNHSFTRSILVTDSGLGGLSVFNEIARQLAQGSPWQRVRLVYFNAWPAPHRGYNHFDTKEKRVRVFNSALNAMAQFDPDLILIACNTLSVIYPHTPFFRSSDIRVEGIVGHGVQLLFDSLTADPDSMAVIMGTPTTIDALTHETELKRRGIAKERMINIGCTNLAGWIEREPFSMTVTQLIRQFVKEAGGRLGGFNGHVYAALCCTHFGYRQELFEQAFADFVSPKVTILNPNIRMARKTSGVMGKQSSFSPEIEMKIVSKAVWGSEQLEACLKLLPNNPRAVRDALINYQLDRRLFSVDD
jgi:glutamate racemase